MKLIKLLLKKMFKDQPPEPVWEYGTINGAKARRHLKTKAVQFYKTTFTPKYEWADHNPDFWSKFKPTTAAKKKTQKL